MEHSLQECLCGRVKQFFKNAKYWNSLAMRGREKGHKLIAEEVQDSLGWVISIRMAFWPRCMSGMGNSNTVETEGGCPTILCVRLGTTRLGTARGRRYHFRTSVLTE
jgi:hypothetical protein